MDLINDYPQFNDLSVISIVKLSYLVQNEIDSGYALASFSAWKGLGSNCATGMFSKHFQNTVDGISFSMI